MSIFTSMMSKIKDPTYRELARKANGPPEVAPRRYDPVLAARQNANIARQARGVGMGLTNQITQGLQNRGLGRSAGVFNAAGAGSRRTAQEAASLTCTELLVETSRQAAGAFARANQKGARVLCIKTKGTRSMVHCHTQNDRRKTRVSFARERCLLVRPVTVVCSEPPTWFFSAAYFCWVSGGPSSA